MAAWVGVVVEGEGVGEREVVKVETAQARAAAQVGRGVVQGGGEMVRRYSVNREEGLTAGAAAANENYPPAFHRGEHSGGRVLPGLFQIVPHK